MIRKRGLHDVFVIGGGIAGLSAAAHAARCGRHVALAEGRGLFGGLIATIGHVEGIFPTPEPSGQSLAMELLQRCTAAGVSVLDSEIKDVVCGNVLKVVTADGKHYPAHAVIVASGGTLRKLNVPGEVEFIGRGVSQCATCDGPFFKAREVAVIGGGDAAMQEAIVLAGYCQKVTIVCRSRLRARQSYIEQLSSRPNVAFVWNATLEAILGTDRVESIRIRDQRSGSMRDQPCSGVFPFVGVEPNGSFVPDSLKDRAGYICTNETLETAEKGIFAAGTVRRGYGGQIMQAAAEGITAAQGALAYCHA